MAGKITNWLQHAWNAFRSDEEKPYVYQPETGVGYGIRPDRVRTGFANERTIIAAIYTKLSMDVAAADMRHVRIDDDEQFLEMVKSPLDNCLTIEANIDQSGRHLRQDAALSMFNHGTMAVVPTETTLNPELTGGYDIQEIRVGEIVEWYPRKVKVRLYDDREEKGGVMREIVLDKKFVAIAENPLYGVMNEPNSTLQRLIRKLNILDSVDEMVGSGKLDLIIQLPYIIRSDARRKEAEERRKSIEMQLVGSKYGIAYTDGTEKITQLNRPAENNLLTQITYLTAQLYTQLGLTEEIFNGSADEKTMLNYYSRTVEPILSAITDSMTRTFLTKTARTQGQRVMFFRDPFKLVPIGELAEIGDKFTRNEILTSNEMRAIIGRRPSKDPRANQLTNKNLSQAKEAPTEETKVVEPPDDQNQKEKE